METWTVRNSDNRAVTGEFESFREAVQEAKRLNEKTPGHYVTNEEGEVDWQG